MTRLLLPAALVAALLISFGLPEGFTALVRGQELGTPRPAGTVFFESATVAQDEALEAHIPDQGIGWAVNEDTTIVPNGSHSLRAIATDHAGNSTVSSEVVVNVRHAAASSTSVAISSPVSGSGVSKAIGLVATPVGEAVLSSVQFRLDGANIGAPDTTPPFTYSWDTTQVADGAYAITAVAVAAGGATSTSAPVILSVYNKQPPAAPSTKDGAKPTISITSPRAGYTASGVVPLSVDASDDVGIKRVQFRLNDNDIGPEINKPPYSYLWNSDASSAAIKVAKGRDWLSPMGFINSARVSYYAKPNPALRTPDYYVQVTLDNESNGSPDEFVWLMIRRTDPGTYYGAGWYASGVANDCYIFKVVAGRYSDLANRDCGFVDGDVIKLAAVGDTLTLSKNGSAVLTAAGGGAINAVGTGGFGYGNIRNASDDTSGALALDDFLIVEGGGGSTALPPAQNVTPIPGPIAGTTPTPTPAPAPAPILPPPPAPTPTAPVAVLPGNHGYFNSLVARPEHWRSFSLRDAAQVNQYRQGRRADVTYSFPNDPDPRQQDAAKVVIADFPQLGGAALAAGMSESDTILITAGGLPAASNVAYRVDNEVMTYVSRVVADGTTRTTVLRGQHGTRPSAHAAGTPVGTGTNNLQSQVRMPMGTEDGHSYLITWDAWYGAETKPAGLTNWKTFQFAQGTSGDGSLGLEVRTRFDGGSSPKISLAGNELAQVDMRRYLAVEDTSLQDQLGPTRTPFAIKAETWTRYWVYIEHVVGDWDRVSLWLADTTRGPVQVLDRVAFEAESHTFRSFWIEFNTSTDRVVPNRGPLVNYVRNLVMLRDVTNPVALMAMPLATTASTSAAPLSAPKNLRIVQTR